MNKWFVVSGFGDSSEFSNCWDCELNASFNDLDKAIKFSQIHYDVLIDECLKGCNAHWYKSIFVQVLDSDEFLNFQNLTNASKEVI